LELHPETRHGGDRKSDQVEKSSTCSDSFAEATAAATGKTSRTVRTAAARGKALGGALKDIAGTSLDSGVELDALAKKPEAEPKPLPSNGHFKIPVAKNRSTPPPPPPPPSAVPPTQRVGKKTILNRKYREKAEKLRVENGGKPTVHRGTP
jgi:ParB family chromosome partitioning protein